MTKLLARYRRLYGSHPLHLLLMLAGFALLGCVLATIKPQTLWNSHVWWQSIAVWFAVAIIGHDVILFPLYAVADRILTASAVPRLKALNYIRVPALGSALTLLVFLPGIIEQGAPTYLAATGQTQEPFLARWLLLTAGMFAVSAVTCALRLRRVRRPRAACSDASAPEHPDTPTE